MTTVRGIYRNGGIVHLQEPLELADNTEVDVSVNPVEVSSQPQSERDRIHDLFFTADLVKPRSQTNAQPPLSQDQEAKLAAKLAKAGSLSELIIKERDEQDDRLLL